LGLTATGWEYLTCKSTERVARVSDEVVVSGGRIIEEIDPLLDGELLLLSSFADGCKGPYWIVGDISVLE